MFTDREQFEQDPRSYALELISEGLVDAETLASACLGWMSLKDVQDMLDANEMSPRFDDDEEPDVDTYTEYQDLPWGGDDAFETCNYSEDF